MNKISWFSGTMVFGILLAIVAIFISVMPAQAQEASDPEQPVTQGEVETIKYRAMEGIADSSDNFQITPTFLWWGTTPRGLGDTITVNIIITGTRDTNLDWIDYFSFTAPTGWTITGIGSAPAQNTAATCGTQNITSGFSATSAYWGWDDGNVDPTDPSTYPPDSDCGVYLANNVAPFPEYQLQVTMLIGTDPSIKRCPGADRVVFGGDDVGSPQNYAEFHADSDGFGSNPGDAGYILISSCYLPQVDVVKTVTTTGDCADGVDSINNLSPGTPVTYCYYLDNTSGDLAEGRWMTNTYHHLNDDILGDITTEPAGDMDAQGANDADILYTANSTAPSSGCVINTATYFADTDAGWVWDSVNDQFAQGYYQSASATDTAEICVASVVADYSTLGVVTPSYGDAWHLQSSGTTVYFGADVDTGVGSSEDTFNADDIDGVSVAGPWGNGPGAGLFDVALSGAVTSNTCVNAWLDWDNDGSFDAGDQIISSKTGLSAGLNTIAFDVPAGTFPAAGNVTFNYRFRVTPDCTSFAGTDPIGVATNGEVGDGQQRFTPTAVSLQASDLATSNPITAFLPITLLLAVATLYVWRRRLQFD